MIGDGGRMVAVGIAPGKTTAPVEITRLVRRGLRIIGSYGARTRADMPEIIRLAAQGMFRPETIVTRRFPLADADAAYQALAAARSSAGPWWCHEVVEQWSHRDAEIQILSRVPASGGSL